MTRKVYTMTQEQYDKILAACQPVPYLVIGGHPPPSPQERANRAWEALGKELGFMPMSVRPLGGNPMAFTAEPVQ